MYEDEKQYLLGSGIPSWKSGDAYDITFIVTEDCNLRCKYCYQVHKNSKKEMTFEIAKKAIDYILTNKDIFSSNSVIWNFIGGEPLLKIDLIDQITDYIKIKAYELKHPWFNMYRINMSTNGILYDDKKVQKFIAKNKWKCSIGISIDGTKEKHDLQRVYLNGKGSYYDVVKNIPLWLKQNPGSNTKVTIGHEDLPFIKESITHLWSLGIKNVPANVVFEDVWEYGDDIIFENQLKELADYIIENQLWNDYNTTLFDDKLGYPYTEYDLKHNFCGAGKMLAIDAEGNLFPCLRYAEYSLNSQNQYPIGDVNNGINFDKVRPFLGLSTQEQSSQKCIDCEVAKGCGWCQGFNYDSSESGTNYKRVEFICKMHKARCRANNYYWGRLKKEFNITRKTKHKGRQHLFFISSDDCVEHCNYSSKNNNSNIMNDEIIKKGMEFCEQNFYTPVILHSKNNTFIKDFNQYTVMDKIELYNSGNKKPLNTTSQVFPVINNDFFNIEDIQHNNCILNIDHENINNLYNIVEEIFKKVSRINLNLKITYPEFNFDSYKDQLEKVSDLIVNYYMNDNSKEFNKITDLLALHKMENCNFGTKNFALAPNGKFYICPSFYFNNPDDYIGTLGDGIQIKDNQLLKLEKSPICRNCDAYQCDRCMYINKKVTGEFNSPTSLQCKIAHIERSISLNFQKKLIKNNIDNFYISNELKEIKYEDPINKIIEKMDSIPYNVFN